MVGVLACPPQAGIPPRSDSEPGCYTQGLRTLDLVSRPSNPMVVMVGVLGFEPRTSCSQSRRASQLRYTPMGVPRFRSGHTVRSVCHERVGRVEWWVGWDSVLGSGESCVSSLPPDAPQPFTKSWVAPALLVPMPFAKVVGRVGLEPTTNCLRGNCSTD